MDDLAKLKLNSDEMCTWFVRLTKSIEDTVKKVIRQKYPLPEDNPLAHEDYSFKSLEAKRNRDRALAVFLKRSNY